MGIWILSVQSIKYVLCKRLFFKNCTFFLVYIFDIFIIWIKKKKINFKHHGHSGLNLHSKLKTVTGVLSDSIFCRNCQSWIQLSCLSKHCIWWLLFRNKKCWPLTFLFLFYSYNTWVCVHNGGLGYISISYHNSNLIQRGKFCQVARRGSSDRQDAKLQVCSYDPCLAMRLIQILMRLLLWW